MNVTPHPFAGGPLAFRLNGNQLKLIAAVSMVIDHIGLVIFPGVPIFRYIGRLAFPIFSFFIFEGYYHTRNRLRYLRGILILGLVCLLGYRLFDGTWYGNVLITFTFSILIMLGVTSLRQGFDKGGIHALTGIIPLLTAVAVALLACSSFKVDYGVAGVMLAVFPALVKEANIQQGSGRIARLLPLAAFAVGTVLLAADMGGRQWFSLLALPLLALYDGTRGKANLKLFFYWFYPVHLLIIGAIGEILSYLGI